MIKIEHKTQVRAQKLVCYTKFTGYHFRTEAQKKSAEQLKNFLKSKQTTEGNQNKTYSGKMTYSARKRLAKAVDLMVQTVERNGEWMKMPSGKWLKFRLAFTTLTIHSPNRMINAKEGYKQVWGPMLRWLRDTHKCYMYLWKAELQQRGQLHYHLLLGKFIDQKELRDKWNELQMKAGYLEDYYNDHGHYDAPSTEIKNTIERGDLAGYLIKEIAKDTQNAIPLDGKVWDCSTNLKEMSYFECDTDKYTGTIAKLAREGKLSISYSDRACTVYKANELPDGNVFKTSNILDSIDRFLYKDCLEYIKTVEIVKKVPETQEKQAITPRSAIVKVPIQMNMFNMS